MHEATPLIGSLIRAALPEGWSYAGWRGDREIVGVLRAVVAGQCVLFVIEDKDRVLHEVSPVGYRVQIIGNKGWLSEGAADAV